MANYGYHAEDRDPVRQYTPTHSSDEDLPRLSNLSLSDRNYRLFSFKKDGRSWINAICSEPQVLESDIKKKALRPRKSTHSVDALLDKMSIPRREAIDDLLDRTIRKDPHGDRWHIVAIENDKPEWTKRTGEVSAFSVILARGTAATRQRTNSISQERRRSSFIEPSRERDYVVPTRRGSKSYNQTRSSPTRANMSARQSQSYRNSQSILEEDPFGNALLFSNDGKPVTTSGAPTSGNAGLPPHIKDDEPIGAYPQEKEKKEEGKSKKGKKDKEDGVIDIDALLGASGLGGDDHDLLIDPEHDDHPDYDFDSPIEIIGEEKSRGRKTTGRGNKTPRQFRSKSKSKSRPRSLSVKIPKDNRYRQPIQEVTFSAKPGRRERNYWGSHGSIHTDPSIHSDQSVLEAEYEEYSSSNSSQGFDHDYHHQQSAYMPEDSRRYKQTNYHRRGPPSPQTARYSELPADYGFQAQLPQRRPSRVERFASDTAVQRYKYAPTRPLLISQASAPRFTPTPISAHPYSYDGGLTPYPGELTQQRPRRDSVDAHQAQLYMEQERIKAKDMELLRRERDLAYREAEMHQEIARRVSSSTPMYGEGERRASVSRSSSKYNHEPRLSRRYTDQYHG